jgi:hypothetical protein
MAEVVDTPSWQIVRENGWMRDSKSVLVSMHQGGNGTWSGTVWFSGGEPDRLGIKIEGSSFSEAHSALCEVLHEAIGSGIPGSGGVFG